MKNNKALPTFCGVGFESETKGMRPTFGGIERPTFDG